MRSDCTYFDYGKTAPTAYGAFCTKSGHGHSITSRTLCDKCKDYKGNIDMKEKNNKVTYYNKLVRDKIPEICVKKGVRPIVRVAEDKEYENLLCAKLEEEVAEYIESRDAHELADILEVVYAIGRAHGFGHERLDVMTESKRTDRGGFKKRLVLIKTVEKKKM